MFLGFIITGVVYAFNNTCGPSVMRISPINSIVAIQKFQQGSTRKNK